MANKKPISTRTRKPKPVRTRIDMKVSPERRKRYERAARKAKVPLTVWLKNVADQAVGQ